MLHRANALVLAALAALIAVACSREPSPDVWFVGSSPPTALEVRGLPAADVAALSRRPLTLAHWRRILRVTARGESVPVAGEYAAAGAVIRFTPAYGFESWRPYRVTFDATNIPGADPSEPWRRNVLSKVFTFAGTSKGHPARVRRVYPSSADLPEDLLRVHIEFSAPMGRASPLDHVRLIDEDGHHVIDPFLPVDADSWSSDRMLLTLSFDPARVKDGIARDGDLGRALMRGRRYTLAIGDRWPDRRGEPLGAEYRHAFTAQPAIETPLDHRQWSVLAPGAGGRDPLVVTFPRPLDYRSLLRSLSVSRDGVEVVGDAAVGDEETRWTFAPRDPWTAGDYVLVVSAGLEDPAGHRPGRLFTAGQPAQGDTATIPIPFRVN